MNFDKWFNNQSRLVQLILLIIPGVGWVVEFLVRLSIFLRTKSGVHLVVLIIFACIGWGWFLNLIDLLYLVLTGHLILAE